MGAGLTWTWYWEVSCMMMLELEYFFLCSEQGVTSHSQQRAGPTALALGLGALAGPQGGRVEARGAAARKDSRV